MESFNRLHKLGVVLGSSAGFWMHNRFVRNRRLVRDYEITTSSAEGWIYINMIGLVHRRLA